MLAFEAVAWQPAERDQAWAAKGEAQEAPGWGSP